MKEEDNDDDDDYDYDDDDDDISCVASSVGQVSIAPTKVSYVSSSTVCITLCTLVIP